LLLLVPIPLIGVLERLRVSDLGNVDVQVDLSRQQQLGTNPFTGFSRFISNPFLLAIGLFIVFYVIMNTFIYFELRKMLGDFDRETRTQIWAGIDLAVNGLAAVTALFATGRLATRVGMSATLALVPVLMVGGWLLVAASPALGVLIGLQVARRAGNYAITRPAREMLFTIVDAETRFKAKPVIDIVVYRGGDVATAWLYTALTATLGLGLAGVAIISAVICAAWGAAGVFLGRSYDSKENSDGA
jgi:AAA family ATP:ADP antiporter